jgi:hypothetical protein
MKLGLSTLVCAAALSSAACAGRHTILAVPAVSMTTPALPPGATSTQIGRVEASFCHGDDPLVSQDSNIGLIDEAIAKAQKMTNATYLKDVTIQSDGACVYVEAMAMH